MKIGSEECDYIVRNLEAVDALIECKYRAQAELGVWICKQIEHRLNVLITSETSDFHGGKLSPEGIRIPNM